MNPNGFLEIYDDGVVGGWAYSATHDYREPLLVEILVRSEVYCTIPANLFRLDLLNNGIGTGDHGFYFSFPKEASRPSKGELSVRFKNAIGEYIYLKSLVDLAPEEPAKLTGLEFTEIFTDTTHSPIFILGSARSGTSALASALLRCTEYQGQEEGHFLEILAYFYKTIEKFFAAKGDEVGRFTMLQAIPREYIYRSLKNSVIESMRTLFPSGKWIDKTPSSNMIYIAPILKEMWPNAKFIFMSRRAIENLRSRRKKFGYAFSQDCMEWTEAAKAWMSVKDLLGDSAIRLEQYHMKHCTETFADTVCAHIGADRKTAQRIALHLKVYQPQSSGFDSNIPSLRDISLTEEEHYIFMNICAPYMHELGYSLDESYFIRG
jgi:hypothetical protein